MKSEKNSQEIFQMIVLHLNVCLEEHLQHMKTVV